jgi:predicted ATPase
MANQQDVNNASAALDEIWGNPPARNGLFGNALRSLSVSGIRGLDLEVEFSWPVAAIGGINGSGKTTLLQLCSCAYTRHGSGARHFTIGRWIGQSFDAVGETPTIEPDASLIYQFIDETPSLSVDYQSARTRWGYPRRGNPERNVDFVGIANFAPRIEKTDRTHQNRTRLEVRATEALADRVVESISRILGNTYDAAEFHTVSAPNAQWTDEIPQLARNGVSYTEAHMGAGEQKLVRLVRHLEGLPRRSLVLLEEPELTLHPDAQFGLAWYLMTLAKRQGHQIIVATHSGAIFEALPQAARIVVSRESGLSTVLHNVTKLAAARELSSSVRANKALILVEDIAAKNLLSQIIDRFASDMRAMISIIDVGSDDDVRRMVGKLRMQEVHAVGVRDPDVGEDGATGLFSLPGDVSPEQVLLEPHNIVRADSFYPGFSAAHARALIQGRGYAGSAQAKRVMRALPAELQQSAEFVSDRLTIAWLSDPENENRARQLVENIRYALEAD